MKRDIHPKYQHNCKVTCACGNTFITGSILPEIHVPICSTCHPFWTGVKKYVDAEGRVEKFERKRAEAVTAKAQKKQKRSKR